MDHLLAMMRDQNTSRHKEQLLCCASRAVLLLLLASFFGKLEALEPTTPLSSFNHQSWVMENGLPQNTVQAMAQGRDGFLWIGTEAGLVRFDGNSFELFDQNSHAGLPAADVRALLAARDGALWIGTGGGLACWQHGQMSTYTTSSGLPGEGIRALAESSDGTLWVWTEQGLARREGNRFVSAANLPASEILAVRAIGDGGLLVVGNKGAALWRAGHWNALPVPDGYPVDGVEFIAELAGGKLALASKTELVIEPASQPRAHLLRALHVGRELPAGRIQALLADRAGVLWIGTNRGLLRYVDGHVERMAVNDALGTASILTLLEDHEGNLWVGTETGGLHILRDQRLRATGVREGLTSEKTTAVVEDGTGRLWVGTAGGGLNQLRDGHLEHAFGVRDGLLSDVVLSLAAARNGDLWVGTPDGLNRIHGGRIEGYTLGDGLPDDFVRSLLADSDGSLWIGTRHGLAHWKNAASAHQAPQIELYSHTNGLGSDLVGAMTRDVAGDLWVATFGGLSRIHGHGITNFTTAQGLSSNVITALLARHDGSLLAGTREHGWNLLRGGRIEAIRGNNLEQRSIYAILEDGLGHLWFATAQGIARCDCAMNGACSHWIEFGTADGLRGREMASASHPSAWRARNGHLWFATAKGLVEVDPAHFPVNDVPPPVVIEHFSIDDQTQAESALQGAMRIPAGHVHFEFGYAAMSFTAPQKVRYRYMLEGFDKGWTEAGARRTAYYTNIPPGRYVFRVEAANNDGVWSQHGAALAFELRPHFYQTWWFYALLMLLVAGIVVAFLRLRLRRAESEFRAVLGERSRIAREIHDTLAQGYVGISVQLEVLSELLRMNRPEAAAKHLDKTRQIVRDGLNDARQSIWALRSQDSGETTLPVRLRRITEKAGEGQLKARFSLYGAYRPLEAKLEQELLRVAEEAIRNVQKHAGASELSVQLEYRPEMVALEVRDNGRGFDAAAAPPSGHYGLTGMRERAMAMGAEFELTSEPGEGSSVRLRFFESRRDAR